MRIWSGVVTALLFAPTIGTGAATAQPASSRFEVGAHASLLRPSNLETTSLGIGGRLTFDLTPWAALEGEVGVFPDDRAVLSSSVTGDLRVSYLRRRAGGFAGVKLGRRGGRAGLFGIVRPGVVRLTDRGIRCVGSLCALALFARPQYRTELALDLGAGIEFYPTSRTVARLDLGDTVIRQRSKVPPCSEGDCTTHNLSTRLGIGLRF